jgi:hypothetical protein
MWINFVELLGMRRANHTYWRRKSIVADLSPGGGRNIKLVDETTSTLSCVGTALFADPELAFKKCGCFLLPFFSALTSRPQSLYSSSKSAR